MFARLFAESGLSLDRLKALLEVGSAGSIAKAADQDPVRQSQYSRQIKELEDFFIVKLIERQGKGTRLTAAGRELARISRFFLLGLSNFHKGCFAEEQTFRIGASRTFIDQFLLPALARVHARKSAARFATETLTDNDIERRLHDMTLDFGVVSARTISRPLQLLPLGEWSLSLWVPKRLFSVKSRALAEFANRNLALALPVSELIPELGQLELNPRLTVESFLDARLAMKTHGIAAILPDFLLSKAEAGNYLRLEIPGAKNVRLSFNLVCNPRLLRLNRHAVRMRDMLKESLRNGHYS